MQLTLVTVLAALAVSVSALPIDNIEIANGVAVRTDNAPDVAAIDNEANKRKKSSSSSNSLSNSKDSALEDTSLAESGSGSGSGSGEKQKGEQHTNLDNNATSGTDMKQKVPPTASDEKGGGSTSHNSSGSGSGSSTKKHHKSSKNGLHFNNGVLTIKLMGNYWYFSLWDYTWHKGTPKTKKKSSSGENTDDNPNNNDGGSGS